MRKFLAVLILACAMAAPAAASAEPSARALALTRRMVAAMHVEETLAPMLRTMMRQQIELTFAQQKGMSDQQRTQMTSAVGETMDEILDAGFMSDLMERFVPAYAEVYTEQELEAVVQFYESPVGQSVLRKMPLMGPAAAKVMVEITPRMQSEMMEKLTRKLEGMKALGK